MAMFEINFHNLLDSVITELDTLSGRLDNMCNFIEGGTEHNNLDNIEKGESNNYVPETS